MLDVVAETELPGNAPPFDIPTDADTWARAAGREVVTLAETVAGYLPGTVARAAGVPEVGLPVDADT